MIPGRSRWIGLAALIAALTIAVWSISSHRNDSASKQGPDNLPRGLPVKAVHPNIGTVENDITAVGSLHGNESVLIRAEVTGRVTGIHFTEGHRVARGSILVQINPTEYAAQRDQIASTVKLNQLNFERAKTLLEEKVISPQAYDEIAAKLKESQANLSFVQERVNKTTIRAPFNGRVGFRRVSPGDYVQPGQAIVNLEDIDPLKVDFQIPEIYLTQVGVGQNVRVGLDAFPKQEFTGRIYAIDPLIDAASRTIRCRALIQNPRGVLRPGMFARISLVFGSRSDAVLIPEQALVLMGDDTYVFRVRNGKAVLTKVEVGQRRDGKIEVVQGVVSSEMVITDGQMKIQDGSPVAVLEEAKTAPESSIPVAKD